MLENFNFKIDLKVHIKLQKKVLITLKSILNKELEKIILNNKKKL